METPLNGNLVGNTPQQAMTVRTRVAPSPTGDPHVGTAYVALFNHVFAKSRGGRFVLRVEDTDQARAVAGAEERILSALRWLGVDWDEGPDVGGAFGPYRQSERLAEYRRLADELLANNKAFRCFCEPERLAELRRRQRAQGETSRYDGRCLALATSDARARAARGDAHVVRLAVPDDGECRFVDGLRGAVAIPWRQVDMQVLVKADGFPTYHLAVVADDHLMRITHVLRGEEWLNSMPKHMLLYEAFGWTPPAHYHLPLLRNPDGGKLSKRKNPTGIDYYRRAGYLPEALLNYLALMGWSMPDEREVFTVAELINSFDVERVSLGGPVFDLAKLNWLNGQHIRALSADQFMDRVATWALNRENLAPLAPLLQQRVERLCDLPPQVDYLLGARVPLRPEDFAHKTLAAEDCKRVLHHAAQRLDEVAEWRRDALHEALKALAAGMGVKLRDLVAPLFVALAGRPVGLPIFDSLAYLGRDLTRARLREGIAALGGVSKKEAARLERAYRQLSERAAPA